MARWLRSMAVRLREWVMPPMPRDGYGQTTMDDLRSFVRYRRCRKMAIVWRAPTREEAARIDDHPVWGRFGDQTIAIADVDGRCWSVQESWWYGYPDRPRYSWSARRGDEVWAAADFNFWPDAWRRAPGMRD